MIKLPGTSLVLALALAGCVVTPVDLGPATSPSPVPTASPTASVTAAPTSPSPTPSPSSSPSPVPTSAVAYKDVQPLLTRCKDCHGGRFASYAAAKSNLDDIIRVTEAGFMPRGGPPLTAAQVATLKAWKAAGTPEN